MPENARHPDPSRARPLNARRQHAARRDFPSSPSSTCGLPAQVADSARAARLMRAARRRGDRRARRRRHPSRRGLRMRQRSDRRHFDRHQQCLSRDARADGHRACGRACRHRRSSRSDSLRRQQADRGCDQRPARDRPRRRRRSCTSAIVGLARDLAHRDVPRAVRHLRRPRRHRHVVDRRPARAGRSAARPMAAG